MTREDHAKTWINKIAENAPENKERPIDKRILIGPIPEESRYGLLDRDTIVEVSKASGLVELINHIKEQIFK